MQVDRWAAPMMASRTTGFAHAFSADVMIRCDAVCWSSMLAIGDGSQVPRRRGDVGCNLAEWIDARYVARNERSNKEGRKKARRRKEEKEGALTSRRKGRLLSTPVLRKLLAGMSFRPTEHFEHAPEHVDRIRRCIRPMWSKVHSGEVVDRSMSGHAMHDAHSSLLLIPLMELRTSMS